MAADDRTTKPARRRPTGWIAITVVLALVAVGLGIWAFSAQSDADDAQAELDAQAAESVAIDPETLQRYEDLKAQLGVAGENIEQLAAQVEEAVANSETAEQARAAADGAVERATAEIEAFRAQATVAQTCLRGTLDALDAAFSAGGLEAAVTELETIASGCRSAASP